VILGKQQLFTENTLTVVLPLMSRRDWPTMRGVLRLWTIVLAANIAGAHVIAWTLVSSIVLDTPLREAVLRISEQATDVTFGAALIKGIFAGWLIALIVWLRAAVDSGEVAIIVLLTYTVALGGFTHVIVGSIESLCLVFDGSKPWSEYAVGYFLPSLIGNILGGVSLVAALNHAQVVAGQAKEE
jgi:formate/nitrite transporter FocA (FNT family)